MAFRVFSCIRILIFLGASFLFTTGALSNPIAEKQPQSTVETFLAAVKSMEFPVADDSGHAQRVSDANAYLDLETMGSKALSDHWEELSPQDRRTFLDLLWKLVETVAYPKNQNLVGGDEIVYGEIAEDENGFQVPVSAKPKDDEPTASIIYHLAEKDGGLKIDDVVLDDVSIIEDLKYQFDKIIAKSGFGGLLDKMRERLAKAEGKNETAKTAV